MRGIRMVEDRATGKEMFDYVGAYENAIKEVVKSCGSREAANEMLDELHDHYQKTDVELRRIEKIYGDRPDLHVTKRAAMLAEARYEAERIIERYAPKSSYRVHEIFLGTSLATAATILPATLAASAFTTAAAIIAIGSAYYIGYRFAKKWKALAGKSRIASCAGTVSPRHVKAHEKLDSWLSSKGLF